MSKYINEDQQLSQSHSQPQPPQQPPELGSLQTSMMEPLRILEPAESRIMVSLEAIELTSNFDDVSEHSLAFYRVSHMYLNDFMRLFRGHWVT